MARKIRNFMAVFVGTCWHSLVERFENGLAPGAIARANSPILPRTQGGARMFSAFAFFARNYKWRFLGANIPSRSPVPLH